MHRPTDPGTPASAEPLVHRHPGELPKEIEMNEYDVLCKGTVIIGSLHAQDVRS